MKMTSYGFWIGVAMTALFALLGKVLATLPAFSIVGPMVLAILLGMVWSTWIGNRLPMPHSIQGEMHGGLIFSSKILLRAGIILLGIRLDLLALADAGIQVLGTETFLVALTLLVGYTLARKMGADRAMAMIVAAGTAICGAAAAVAIAVQVRAKSEQTVLGVATVAVLGTLFTIADTLLYPILQLSPHSYGIYTGATLHEIAHVIAAATPFGSDSLDTAILVKLSRVVLLAPVAVFVGWWFSRADKPSANEGNTKTPLPIPWFVLGFLAVGALHTWHLLPSNWTPNLISTSLFLLTMGMAGLGLQVNIRALRGGQQVFLSALITSVALSIVGYITARFFLS